MLRLEFRQGCISHGKGSTVKELANSGGSPKIVI